MRATMASSTSGTPVPCLAEMASASSPSSSSVSVICVARALDVGRREIDLVDDGNDGEVRVAGEVEVGQRLRLDALGGVDDENGALARGQRPRHLVREVDVARRVDEIERVLLAVARPVEETHGVRLDRDAALALEIHRVEHLIDRLLGVHRAGEREQPVGQRRLAVIDVGDDGEIADAIQGHRLMVTRRVAAAGARRAVRQRVTVARSGTTAPDSSATSGPTCAWAPIRASAPTTQSRSTAPAPTSTRSHRMAPSTRAPAPMRAAVADHRVGADAAAGDRARRRRRPRRARRSGRRARRSRPRRASSRRAAVPGAESGWPRARQQVDLRRAVRRRVADVAPVGGRAPAEERDAVGDERRERTRARSSTARSGGMRGEQRGVER